MRKSADCLFGLRGDMGPSFDLEAGSGPVVEDAVRLLSFLSFLSVARSQAVLPSFRVFVEWFEEPDVLTDPRRAAAILGKYPSVCPGRAVLGVDAVGVCCTEITDRIGKTLSAVAGLRASSGRKVGEFGGI